MRTTVDAADGGGAQRDTVPREPCAGRRGLSRLGTAVADATKGRPPTACFSTRRPRSGRRARPSGREHREHRGHREHPNTANTATREHRRRSKRPATRQNAPLRVIPVTHPAEPRIMILPP